MAAARSQTVVRHGHTDSTHAFQPHLFPDVPPMGSMLPPALFLFLSSPTVFCRDLTMVSVRVPTSPPRQSRQEPPLVMSYGKFFIRFLWHCRSFLPGRRAHFGRSVTFKTLFVKRPLLCDPNWRKKHSADSLPDNFEILKYDLSLRMYPNTQCRFAGWTDKKPSTKSTSSPNILPRKFGKSS